jgi:hypothetical protein
MKSLVRPELPTASACSSQATSAAVDNSAPVQTRPFSLIYRGLAVQTNRATSEFGAQLYWSTPDSAKDERHEFTDQPEFRDQDITDLIDNFDLVELTKEKFEALWARSKQ